MEPGSTELISHQLAMLFATILLKMRELGYGDQHKLRKLAKRSIQRVMPDIKRIPTLSFIKVYTILETFGIGKNIVRLVIEESLRRKYLLYLL